MKLHARRNDPARALLIDVIERLPEGDDSSKADVLGQVFGAVPENAPSHTLQAIAEEMAWLVIEGEPWQAAAVLRAWTAWTKMPSLDVLCDLAASDLDVLAGPDVVRPDRPLRDQLMEALARHVGQPRSYRALWLLRHEALQPGRAGAVLPLLKGRDDDWLKLLGGTIAALSPDGRRSSEESIDELLLDQIRAEPNPASRSQLLQAAAVAISVDTAEGIVWRRHLLSEAAALGNLDAALAVGMHISTLGEAGETDELLSLLGFAADRGHGDACFLLGRILLLDEASRTLARRYLKKAVDAGIEDARAILRTPPPVEAEVVYASVTLGMGPRLRLRLRAALVGEQPLPLRRMQRHPFEFIADAWNSHGYTAPGNTLAHAMGELLTDPDATVRAQSIHFFQAASRAPGAQALELAFEDTDLFEGVPDPIDGRYDLRSELGRALVMRLSPGRSTARDLLRLEVLEPGRAGPVIAGLFVRDRDWMVENAAAAMATSPAVAENALNQFRRAGLDPGPTVTSTTLDPELLSAAIRASYGSGPDADRLLGLL